MEHTISLRNALVTWLFLVRHNKKMSFVSLLRLKWRAILVTSLV